MRSITLGSAFSWYGIKVERGISVEYQGTIHATSREDAAAHLRGLGFTRVYVTA